MKGHIEVDDIQLLDVCVFAKATKKDAASLCTAAVSVPCWCSQRQSHQCCPRPSGGISLSNSPFVVPPHAALPPWVVV